LKRKERRLGTIGKLGASVLFFWGEKILAPVREEAQEKN
jgi:hypothetical protein